MESRFSDPLFVTIPTAAKQLGIGLNLLRRHARAGSFPVYDAQTARPRVQITEVVTWIRSTRRVPTNASYRAAEVVERRLAKEASQT